MNYIANRRHKRSYSINRFEDLDLHINEDNTDKEKTEEASTKTTPLSEVLIQIPHMTEFNNVIQNIQNKISSEFVDRSEKNKEIRSKILKELYRNASTHAATSRKEDSKNIKSIEKTSKKTLPTQTPKTGLKPLKPKLKRTPSVIQNFKENIPIKKLSGKRPLSRNQRNKSHDLN